MGKQPRSVLPKSQRRAQQGQQADGPARQVDLSQDEGANALAKLQGHPAAQAEHHIQAALKNDSTGRHFLISLPRDFSDFELFSVVGWLSTKMRQHLEELRAQPQDEPPVPPAEKPAEPDRVDLAIARSMPTNIGEIKRQAGKN